MSWIEITEAHVLTVLNSKELVKIRAAALADGQADPVEETIPQVVDEVRGFIAACEDNRLAEGDTIPENLLQTALNILAVRIPQRVDFDPSKGREVLYKSAIRVLELVAACKFRVSQPDGDTDDTFATDAAVEVVKKTTPKATRETMDGL